MKERRNAYEPLVIIVICIGVMTFAGGLFWLVAGAGIYGSPVPNAFNDVDPPTRLPISADFWMLWVIVAGPMALLPLSVLELRFPRYGAVAMMLAAMLTAEFGIRASRMAWGFYDEGAIHIIIFITTPMILLAVLMLVLKSERRERKVWLVCVATMAIFLGALVTRYIVARGVWNANCPMRPHVYTVPGRGYVVP